MSNSAVLSRPQEEVQEAGWIELEDLEDGLSSAGLFVEPDVEFTEMEVPVVTFETQDQMRFGPRTYTPDQAEVIHLATRQRRPLPADPLPFDE